VLAQFAYHAIVSSSGMTIFRLFLGWCLEENVGTVIIVSAAPKFYPSYVLVSPFAVSA
jgi:hypothetical protein